MSIHVRARGSIDRALEAVGSEVGDVSAFILRTPQPVSVHGQVVLLESVPTLEVVCTGELANAVLALEPATPVEVVGSLVVRMGEHPSDELRGLVEIHAESCRPVDADA